MQQTEHHARADNGAPYSVFVAGQFVEEEVCHDAAEEYLLGKTDEEHGDNEEENFICRSNVIYPAACDKLPGIYDKAVERYENEISACNETFSEA